MANGNGDSLTRERVERVADDVWFRLAARASMLVLGFAGLPLILYIGGGALKSIEELRKDQTAMFTQLQILQTTITLQMVDRYRGDDARRDFQVRDLKIENNKDRIDKNERRLEAVEQRIGADRK